MINYDAVIIGAGMSGLTAAILLIRKGKKVCLIERQEKPGKKLLLTGNGKCNITNMNMSQDHYVTDDKDKLIKILNRFDTEKELSFYKSLGLYLKEKGGYVYPVSNQAATVLEVMLKEIKGKAEILLDCFATEIAQDEKGFTVVYDNKGSIKKVKGTNVIIATGGLAGVYKENEKNGNKLIKRVGHKLLSPHPALVQTICNEDKSFFKEVMGVRCDATLSLLINEKHVSEDTGELQLTEKGLSGIPVFQLSRYMGKALEEKKQVTIKVDYLPYISFDELMADIRSRYKNAINTEMETEKVFSGILNKKLLSALLKKARLSPTRTLSEGLDDKINNFAKLIKEDIVVVNELNGFEKAQISTGGVRLLEVSENMESENCKNLYILGEALNVAGECGGYNLHFAAASAVAAVENIGK